MNFFSPAKAFPTEEHALAYWMKTRWPKGVRCIACDHPKCYLIESKGKTGKSVRLFECADCGLQFSATTGTLFHDSHLPLQKWFMAIGLMVGAKKGISANQIARHIGVTHKNAWHLCQRTKLSSAQGKWQEHSLRTLATIEKRALQWNEQNSFDTERNGAGELVRPRPSRATTTSKFPIAERFQTWLSGTLRNATTSF